MVRSAAAVLALLILPGFALGQQGTHTVVGDDTLWDLSVRYYQDPFQWRLIYEANRDSIADPNLIFPNEVFVIPGLPGQSGQVVATNPVVPADPSTTNPTDVIVPSGTDPVATPIDVDPAPADVPVDLVQFGFRQARPAEQVRTIFHTDTVAQRAAVIAAAEIEHTAVSRDAVFSAPWVIPLGTTPENEGTLAGLATEGARASLIRNFDEVFVNLPTPARVGADLQTFRVMRTIERVGEVVVPTGVVTVMSIGDDGTVAVVTREYGRILPGDFVRTLPAYTMQPGRYAEPVAGGSEAMIMGFAGRQELTNVGHVAFLDLGSNDGIVIGDEFVRYGSVPGAAQGTLQVIGVTPTMSAARAINMVDDVFQQGVVVRLARKMR